MTGRAEQRERTRRTLVAEARRLFAERGYAAVGLAEIVRAAGVTKGALYHQFDAKTDLFRAVLREVQEEVGREVAAAAEAHADPWARFTAGCRAFLTASTHPGRRRIMLVDGPAVVGWAEWRAMDADASVRHLREALAELMDEGVIARRPVGPLTHLLSGAMNEAALFVAESGDPGDLSDTIAALEDLLKALHAE